MDSPPRTLPGRKGHWPPPVASEGDAVPPAFTASAQPSPRCIHGVSAKPQNSVTLAVRPSIHPSRSTWPLARTEETITQVAERRVGGGREQLGGQQLGRCQRSVPGAGQSGPSTATARLHASGHAPLQADSAVARAPRVTRPSPSRLEASLRHADQHHLCVRTGMAGLSPGVSRGSAGQGSGIVMAGPGSLLWRGFHPQPRNLRVPQARPPKQGAPKSGSAGCLPKSEHRQTHFENAL